MGTEVNFEAPPFVKHPFRMATDAPSAWIEREHPFDAAPRLLVSLFLPDQPGLFRAALVAIDEGVVAPARGGAGNLDAKDRTVKFSVDGSLASVLRGAFMAAIVVRPLIPEQLSSAAPDVKDLLPELLREAVAKELDQLGLPESTFKDIEVLVFEGKGDKLFANRRFSEYRFGVLSGAHDGPRRLAQMTLEFSKKLGDSRVPIAYLFFPDVDNSTTPSIDWVRLGIGAPKRAVDSMELDLAANDLATKYRCIYRKYDATRREKPEVPYSEIANYDESSVGAHAVIVGGEEHLESQCVDVVFALGAARAGLVGDMLAGEAGPRLLAGSMTVIAGHTISCWVVPEGSGGGLVSHIRRVDVNRLESELKGVHILDSLEVKHGRPNERESLWIAWRCRDEPGVARKIVDRVFDHICATSTESPDVTYAISRVLASGQSCAGKIKVCVPKAYCDSATDWLDGLRLALSSSLSLDEVSGQPPDIRVGRDEPNEEPWASLLFI